MAGAASAAAVAQAMVLVVAAQCAAARVVGEAAWAAMVVDSDMLRTETAACCRIDFVNE